MKILEKEEFFKTFNDSAWTYDHWLETFEKNESKDNIQNHFKASSFIERIADYQLRELRYKQFILAVVADWCGDCQRSIPILEHIVKANSNLQVKYLKKEDNIELIVPSNGSEKIPYVMFYSEDGFYVSNWVERSYEIYKMTSDYMKKFNYQKNEAFFSTYRTAIEKDKNMLYQSTADEIIHTILKVNSIQGSSTRINTKS